MGYLQSWNGESGNRMRRMMVEIMGMREIRVRMRGIGMGMRGIMVKMLGIRVGMLGIGGWV